MANKTVDFGPAISPLTKPAALPPLDSGEPDNAVFGALQGLTIEKAFDGQKVKDKSMAQCCLSGLWLLHGYLDRSHQISQQVGSPTGSYWHGIMHRRDGDYGNSKYWFRRVGNHVIWKQLALDAARTMNESGKAGKHAVTLKSSVWDPYSFVDLCKEFAGTSTEMETRLQEVQMREWELLFAYTYAKALGLGHDFPIS